MTDKHSLRQEMKKLRKSLAPEFVKRTSLQIGNIGDQWMKEQGYRIALFYMPIRNEVDVRYWMENCWHSGRRVVLPRSNPHDFSLSCYIVEDYVQLQEGAYGILEPDPQQAEWIDPHEIELVLVPGVAFDLQGYRLGFGAGYYDRFLQDYPHLETLGTAFDIQVVPTVYPEKHDQRLMYILTQDQLFTFI